MSTCIIPEGYRPPLSVYDMQCAIEFIKGNFQDNLKRALNLRRVSAPLFVRADTGLNDDLNGYERAVSFDIPAADGCTVYAWGLDRLPLSEDVRRSRLEEIVSRCMTIILPLPVTVDGKRTFPDEDTTPACIYVRSKEIVWLFP